MPQIEIRENKVLKLTNVLSRKVPEKELLNQDKQIAMLMNWIKAKGYQTVGPLIMYSTGIIGVDGEGQPIINSRVMIQLNTSKVIPDNTVLTDKGGNKINLQLGMLGECRIKYHETTWFNWIIEQIVGKFY